MPSRLCAHAPLRAHACLGIITHTHLCSTSFLCAHSSLPRASSAHNHLSAPRTAAHNAAARLRAAAFAASIIIVLHLGLLLPRRHSFRARLFSPAARTTATLNALAAPVGGSARLFLPPPALLPLLLVSFALFLAACTKMSGGAAAARAYIYTAHCACPASRVFSAIYQHLAPLLLRLPHACKGAVMDQASGIFSLRAAAFSLGYAAARSGG